MSHKRSRRTAESGDADTAQSTAGVPAAEGKSGAPLTYQSQPRQQVKDGVKIYERHIWPPSAAGPAVPFEEMPPVEGYRPAPRVLRFRIQHFLDTETFRDAVTKAIINFTRELARAKGRAGASQPLEPVHTIRFVSMGHDDWFIDVSARSLEQLDHIRANAVWMTLPLPPNRPQPGDRRQVPLLDCVGSRVAANTVTMRIDSLPRGVDLAKLAECFVAWVGAQHRSADVPSFKVEQMYAGFLELVDEPEVPQFKGQVWAMVSVGTDAECVDQDLISSFPGWWPYLGLELRLQFTGRFPYCGKCRLRAREPHSRHDCPRRRDKPSDRSGRQQGQRTQEPVQALSSGIVARLGEADGSSHQIERMQLDPGAPSYVPGATNRSASAVDAAWIPADGAQLRDSMEWWSGDAPAPT